MEKIDFKVFAWKHFICLIINGRIHWKEKDLKDWMYHRFRMRQIIQQGRLCSFVSSLVLNNCRREIAPTNQPASGYSILLIGQRLEKRQNVYWSTVTFVGLSLFPNVITKKKNTTALNPLSLSFLYGLDPWIGRIGLTLLTRTIYIFNFFKIYFEYSH